jgi:hypothetical protein
MNKTRKQKKIHFYGGVYTPKSTRKTHASHNMTTRNKSKTTRSGLKIINTSMTERKTKSKRKKQPEPPKPLRLKKLIFKHIISDIRNRKHKEELKKRKFYKFYLEHEKQILNLALLKKFAKENIELIEELFHDNNIGVEYYTSVYTPSVISVYLYLGHDTKKTYFYKTTFGFNKNFEDGVNNEEFMEFMESILEFLPRYKAKEFEKGQDKSHLYFYTTLCLLNGFYFAYFVQGYIISKAYLAGIIYAEKEDMTDNSDKIRNFNIMLCFYPKEFTSLHYAMPLEDIPERPYHEIKSAFEDDSINTDEYRIKELDKSPNDPRIALYRGTDERIMDLEPDSVDSSSTYSTEPDSESSSISSDSDSSVATAISVHDSGKLAILSDTVRFMNTNLPRMIKKVNDKFVKQDIASKIHRIDEQKSNLKSGAWGFNEPDPDHTPVDYLFDHFGYKDLRLRSRHLLGYTFEPLPLPQTVGPPQPAFAFAHPPPPQTVGQPQPAFAFAHPPPPQTVGPPQPAFAFAPPHLFPQTVGPPQPAFVRVDQDTKGTDTLQTIHIE